MFDTDFEETRMIHLSELIRTNPEQPFSLKWDSLWKPEVYVAENISDYKENRSSIFYPWYKDFPIGLDPREARAFFFLPHVQLTSLSPSHKKDRDGLFHIHDDTGDMVADWDGYRGVHPPSDTFASVREREGLEDGDWVYLVIFLYLKENDSPLICEVLKNKPSPNAPDKKKESMAGSFGDYIPQPAPLLTKRPYWGVSFLYPGA